MSMEGGWEGNGLLVGEEFKEESTEGGLSGISCKPGIHSSDIGRFGDCVGRELAGKRARAAAASLRESTAARGISGTSEEPWALARRGGSGTCFIWDGEHGSLSTKPALLSASGESRAGIFCEPSGDTGGGSIGCALGDGLPGDGDLSVTERTASGGGGECSLPEERRVNGDGAGEGLRLREASASSTASQAASTQRRPSFSKFLLVVSAFFSSGSGPTRLFF